MPSARLQWMLTTPRRRLRWQRQQWDQRTWTSGQSCFHSTCLAMTSPAANNSNKYHSNITCAVQFLTIPHSFHVLRMDLLFSPFCSCIKSIGHQSVWLSGNVLVSIRDVRILRAQNFAENRPPCAEFGVLRRIEENLPNGAENAIILLIFVSPFTYNGSNYTVYHSLLIFFHKCKQ